MGAFFGGIYVVQRESRVANPSPSNAGLYVTVISSTIANQVSLPALAEWTVSAVPTPGLTDGVVTGVSLAEVTQIVGGETLLFVDQQPVTAWIGEVPAYREFGIGDRGSDVNQFISYLVLKGFLASDSARTTFDSSVQRATRNWQRQIGLPETGRFQPQWFVFFPVLPALVSVDADVGDQVAEDDMLKLWAPEPRIFVDVGGAPAGKMVEGLSASIGYGALTWDANVSAVVPIQSESGTISSDGSVRADLTPTSNSPCVCESIPYEVELVRLQAIIEIIPPITGPAVPAAAIGADAFGATFVIDESGSHIPVEVLAMSDGQAVVSGVQVGRRIRAIVEVVDARSVDPAAEN